MCTLAPLYACEWEMLCNKRVSAESFHKGPQWVDNEPRGEHGLLWRLKWGDPTPSLYRAWLSDSLCSTFSPLTIMSRLKVSLFYLCMCYQAFLFFMLWPFLMISHSIISALFLLFLNQNAYAFYVPFSVLLSYLYFFQPAKWIDFPHFLSLSAFHFIPSHLSSSIPLQLWQRMISSPILSCVPRLPWTRAAF